MPSAITRTASWLSVLPLVAFTGCAARHAMPDRPARISHVVLISLHDPARANEAIQECDAMLASIPGVVSYAAGSHIDTGRANVDGEYDLGLYIGFESTHDYAVYVDHPNHVALVNKWKPHIKQMRVFDLLDHE